MSVVFILSPTLPAPVAAAQLIWRALGPREWLRPHAVQDWAGLGSTDVEPVAIVAARYQVTRQTLLNWRTIVVEYAHTITVPAAVTRRLTRPTSPGENHLARKRQASLFGLKVARDDPEPGALNKADSGLNRAATRILAALGAIPVAELTAALNRARPRTRPTALTGRQVLAMLSRSDTIIIERGHVRLAQASAPWPHD